MFLTFINIYGFLFTTHCFISLLIIKILLFFNFIIYLNVQKYLFFFFIFYFFRLSIFDEVATQVVLGEFDSYGDIHDEIYVRISDLPIKDKLRDLRQANLHQLVRVEGVVTRRTSGK
jgi:hypothetical protein